MAAHFTLRTYGVNKEFRYFEGCWLHRKSRQLQKKNRKRPISHHTCATCSELPSYISTILQAVIDFRINIYDIK